MKIIQADGSIIIVEDETFKNNNGAKRKFNQCQPRARTLEIILETLRLVDGQTVDDLAESTKIPTYFLSKYLLDLEKEKRIKRSGSRHYLVATPPSPEFL